MKQYKPDSSPQVSQRDKLKNPLFIKEFGWTEKQKKLIECCLDKDTKIVFISGPAGTSKTLTAVYCALRLITNKKVSDILYLRSAVESSDSHIGFLPGTAGEKLHFYNLPFFDKLDELLQKADIERLKNEERISTYPINFSRGMSWNAKCILMDEAQNSTFKEIVTVITRLGLFSKCFVLADPSQTDLCSIKSGGFVKLFNTFSDEESKKHGIFTFEFTEEDIVRSDIVRFIVKKLT
jgi:phosphate starvation-inducible protein PhoH and related proteins